MFLFIYTQVAYTIQYMPATSRLFVGTYLLSCLSNGEWCISACLHYRDRLFSVVQIGVLRQTLFVCLSLYMSRQSSSRFRLDPVLHFTLFSNNHAAHHNIKNRPAHPSIRQHSRRCVFHDGVVVVIFFSFSFSRCRVGLTSAFLRWSRRAPVTCVSRWIGKLMVGCVCCVQRAFSSMLHAVHAYPFSRVENERRI